MVGLPGRVSSVTITATLSTIAGVGNSTRLQPISRDGTDRLGRCSSAPGASGGARERRSWGQALGCLLALRCHQTREVFALNDDAAPPSDDWQFA